MLREHVHQLFYLGRIDHDTTLQRYIYSIPSRETYKVNVSYRIEGKALAKHTEAAKMEGASANKQGLIRGTGADDLT